MDFDADSDDEADSVDEDDFENDDDDDGTVMASGVTLFKKTQKKTLKFRAFSMLFSIINAGEAPALHFGDFKCKSECKNRPWEVRNVKNSTYRLTKVQYEGPFKGCERTCSFNGGKQQGYFAQELNAVYQIADFNLPQFPWLSGKVEIPCNPTIGIGWKGFIVGKKGALVEKKWEEGQAEPRKQCSLCDLTITVKGVKVDISNLPLRFWFCKHKDDGFKLKLEVR
jgi:hypothetical protein